MRLPRKWAAVLVGLLFFTITWLANAGAGAQTTTVETQPDSIRYQERLATLCQEVTDPRKIRRPVYLEMLECIEKIADRHAVLSTMRPLFAHWLADYERLLLDLRGEGYDFGSLETYTAGQQKRRMVFLRYDIHIADLIPMFGMIDVNRRLGIPGVFYVIWDHTPDYKALRPAFGLLQRFQPDGVHVGLHAAPAASVVLENKFNHSVPAYREWIRSADRDTFYTGMGAEELEHYRLASQQRLSDISAAYRDAFPDTCTITGHGSPIGGILFRLNRRQPGLESAVNVFHSTAFLNPNRTYATGFLFEAGNVLPHAYDGISGEQLNQGIQRAMAGGGAFVVLIHPSKPHTREGYRYRPLTPGFWEPELGEEQDAGQYE